MVYGLRWSDWLASAKQVESGKTKKETCASLPVRQAGGLKR